ncbi:MAG: DUF1553 domain-containing protein [Fimbriiglobus sp.]
MTRRSFLVLLAAAGFAPAADLRVLPPAVPLSGPRASQQLLVVVAANGRATADRTANAKFTSDKPAVATVDAAGVVRPVADGTATITATVNGATATANVTVTRAKNPATVSFRHDVQPTLTRAGCNMGACHGALAGKGGFRLSLRAYDPDADFFTITRQASARRTDSAKPEESLLLAKAVRALPHGGGTRFDDDSEHYRVLRDWIAAGAPGPSRSDAVVSGIEVFPKAALLASGDKLRVIVRATYSDGTTRDVTHLAKFVSSELGVAAVDEDGLVSVAGHGEAGVAAIFDTKVAVATITSPFPNRVDPAAFVAPPAAGTVDRLVLAKLKLLNLPPSPPCSDAEFVRRATLDVCGVLPTPDAVRTFVADTSPDKRAKLIDALLARPEYVDYWAHKWSDLLLVSTRKLQPPAMWAMYKTVRRAVADNRGWDRFARDVLTASGSTLGSGGGNYFVMHKDVTDLAESTASTFLGMAVGCAKCHNHPLEKWTQDQYWGFANLFSRVGLKDGPRPGEVIVLSLPAGDALHPRTGKPTPPAPFDGSPLTDPAADRRAYFADWLTKPDNPFFAKAAVNRVWRALMGRGLVEAEDDLRDTNPPTNPDLLDALTADFVAHGFDVKHLIRVILTSEAYQRSSVPLPANAADDRFYSRYLVRRLPAEVILDAYSDVTGVPTPFTHVSLGPSGGERMSTDFPMGTRAVQLPDALLISRFLDSFGRAEREQVCACERTTDASVAQALHLNNGQTLNDKLRDPKSRVSGWLAAGTPDDEIVDRVFSLALSRPPTPTEKAKFLAALADAGADPKARREAVEDVAWAVLSGKEFLFNR